MRIEQKVLGIMSGTSLDGADFVLVKINSKQKKLNVQYLNMQSFRFSKALKKSLSLAAQHQLKTDALALLHHELGRFYSRCFKKLPIEMRKVDLIGLHGQTVFHQAPQATLQIGEPSYLAEAAKVPVIADFRVADLALGGQGAPIATLFHDRVFASKKNTVAIHNLGGISNLSLISRGKVLQSFDTGPANMLLDICMRKHTRGKKQFDRNGAMARRGLIDHSLVERMLRHPYFRKRAPKSCGREEFGEHFYEKFFANKKLSKIEDRMSTLVELTALSIARAYQRQVLKTPTDIVFCGGGALNSFLIERIQFHLPKIHIKTCEDHGWPVSSIEGAAFALLAYFRMMQWPSNYPQTTGARRATSLGKIVEV